MKNTIKTVVLLFIIIILSGFISPYAGKLYEFIINENIPAGWIGTCPECWQGFMISFVFLSGLLFFGFLDKKIRLYISLIFVLIFPLLAFTARDGEAFLVSLGFGAIGLGLGQIVYLIRGGKKQK